jgi:DNA-binding NtrC family response regulator
LTISNLKIKITYIVSVTSHPIKLGLNNENLSMETASILIIDDDQLFRQTAEQQLGTLGFKTSTAKDGAEGNQLVQSEEFALILLDLRLSDTDGLTMLKNWQQIGIQVPVVMISGSGTIPEAVEALKIGAADFLVKPVDINLLEAVVNRTLTSQKLKRENRQLKELARGETAEFLGTGAIVKELLTVAEKVAQSDHPVLLEGETGTGKQVLAHFIYDHSPRIGEPFVSVNCAAITPTLFESELFGHEKGAFTGAFARKLGKLELVGKGTLFLDEIGELPLACQAKLLTAVEDCVFERVGGTSSLRFDGRIIAATNRNIEKEINNGNFRKDLFYRLNTFRLKLPPLREHPEDIPIYIEDTLRRCSRKQRRNYEMPNPDIIQRLSNYHWYGNVRELVHHVERISLFAESRRIPDKLWLSLPIAIQDTDSEITETNLQAVLDDCKRQHVMKVLANCGGNQTEAAKRLGIGRTYLNRLLANYKK